LETFARFGTRLDDQTRRILEHGERIRACLKQPQFHSVTVQEQLVVLLALSAGFFDQVPLEQMADAEQAVRSSASQLSAEIFRLLTAANELKQADRDVILANARAATAKFQKSI